MSRRDFPQCSTALCAVILAATGVSQAQQAPEPASAPPPADTAPAAAAPPTTQLPPVVIEKPAERRAKPRPAPQARSASRVQGRRSASAHPSTNTGAPPQSSVSNGSGDLSAGASPVLTPTGYNATNAVSATKTDTPIRQTPFAVQVVTQQTMEDQQATRLQEAILGNVSSVAPSANGFSDNTNFNIRGFSTGPNVYQVTLLIPYTQNVDLANIQSIEVLKGPAAALYGRMPPGGLVNYLTKQPLTTPYYSIEEILGSFGMTRTTVDLTGPIDPAKTLSFQFNTDYT